MSTDLSPIEVLVVTGPTASGKTDLLDRVFGGGAFFLGGGPDRPLRFADGREVLGAEVVSADSMQAYRHMDIGTSKPAPELLKRLPHHLLDIKEPSEQYTAGEFVQLADALCAQMHLAGILPIISGGTGFYVKNFICGLPSGPPSDPEIRAAVARELAEKGVNTLWKELEAVDPESAAKIHLNDVYRVRRALEIWRSSGVKPSSFAPENAARSSYRFLVLGVNRPREEVNERIDRRVDSMLRDGLEREIKDLVDMGCGARDPGMRAIGYREFFEDGSLDSDKIAEKIKLHTRQYAKRQMTFFRSLPGIQWIGPDSSSLSDLVEGFLARR